MDVVMPVTEIDRANLIFERILYAPQQATEAHQRPEQGRTPSKAQEQEKPGQRAGMAQEQPQPTAERPSEPPKKDIRSGPDSPDTRASSSTSRGGSPTTMTSERPSVLGRLKEYQAIIQQQSAPAKSKTRKHTKTK